MIAVITDIEEITDICIIPKDSPDAEVKLFCVDGGLSDNDPGVSKIFKTIHKESEVAY